MVKSSPQKKSEKNSFEKNKTGDKEVEMTHGELNPKPEQAPVNENKEKGGNEEGDGIRPDKSESNVTVPSNEDNKPAFAVEQTQAHDLQGRDMAVVAPRQS